MRWLALAGLVTLLPVAAAAAQPEPPSPPVECCTPETSPPEPETTPPTTGGSHYVLVPPLTDLTVAGAREELKNRSLVLSTDAPDEYVVTSQDPAAGAEVEPGSAVFVQARPPSSEPTTASPQPAPAPPPEPPDEPGRGTDGSPWTTVAYVGGGGALLALLGFLLVPLVRRWSRPKAATNTATAATNPAQPTTATDSAQPTAAADPAQPTATTDPAQPTATSAARPRAAAEPAQPTAAASARPRVAAGVARFVTAYPLPHVAVRDLPGRPSVTVTLRLAVDPDHRRAP